MNLLPFVRCIANLLLVSTLLVSISQAREPAPVRMESVGVAMRDGIVLATDIYQVGQAKAPVVVMRTPYNKSRVTPIAERFAREGYIVVVQDCRGTFKSKGDLIPYNNEGQDGFDAIEWVYRQSWCNGRIGMWGSSYVGATQWQAAAEKPPGLVTISPTATWSSFYRNLYLGGAVRLSLIAKWAGGNSTKPENAKVTDQWDAALMHLPLSEMDTKIGWPIPWLTGMLTHNKPDGYWNRLNLTNQITDLDLSVLHVVGYYDFFSRESVDNFMIMQKKASKTIVRKQQQLILGPWDHGTIGKSKVGDIDFGPNAIWDPVEANLDWFNRFLKQDTKALEKPFIPVRYFSVGDNTWNDAGTWPPEGFENTSFYLHSNGNANGVKGDGALNLDAPAKDETADSFKADPANPVPALPVTDKRPLHLAHWAPVDQRPIEERKDVLVYTSKPLDKPLRFAGNPKAELFVSTDTKDADWVVKLIDVAPDGFSYNLVVGILRGSFRDSILMPKEMKPGEVYKITVDLGPIAAELPKGHSLRVQVCGSYFPLFDRNTNTAEGPFSKTTVIATEKVFHQQDMASRIILPCKK